MTDAVRQADAFLARYGLDPREVDVDACARAFQADMERGLRGEPGAWMLMLPTYLSQEGELPEDEPIIVIDAGGTNFRVGLVTIRSSGVEIEDLKVSPMPGSQAPISWEEFVDQVAEAVLPLTGRSRKVGLCFSYAAEILPNRDGRVVRFTKQVQVSGSEGKELGRDISAALAAKGAPGTSFVVLNDTVAALLGGVASLRDERFDSYIGLIYGTGVNTCYAERRKALEQVTTPWAAETMLVNMESARFDGAPMSEFDRRLDRESVDLGLCHYEKMVSGRYQGDVIYQALRQAAADGLFSGGLNDWLGKLEGLTSVQADAFCARPYGEGLLAAACTCETDRELLYTIIDRVIERSARLVCANLAGILLQTGAGEHIHRPACIIAEGSTFYKGHLFRGKIQRICDDYITGKLGRYYAFRQVADANLIGTAAAALLNG